MPKPDETKRPEGMPHDEWWETNAGKKTAGQLARDARELEGNAIDLARAAQYYEARSLGHTHEKALMQAIAAEKAVRKALGYTFP